MTRSRRPDHRRCPFRHWTEDWDTSVTDPQKNDACVNSGCEKLQDGDSKTLGIVAARSVTFTRLRDCNYSKDGIGSSPCLRVWPFSSLGYSRHPQSQMPFSFFLGLYLHKRSPLFLGSRVCCICVPEVLFIQIFPP